MEVVENILAKFNDKHKTEFVCKLSSYGKYCIKMGSATITPTSMSMYTVSINRGSYELSPNGLYTLNKAMLLAIKMNEN